MCEVYVCFLFMCVCVYVALGGLKSVMWLVSVQTWYWMVLWLPLPEAVSDVTHHVWLTLRLPTHTDTETDIQTLTLTDTDNVQPTATNTHIQKYNNTHQYFQKKACPSLSTFGNQSAHSQCSVLPLELQWMRKGSYFLWLYKRVPGVNWASQRHI